MLDPVLLRQHTDSLVHRLQETRGFSLDTEFLSTLQTTRKDLLIRTQDLQAKRNMISKAIGQAKAAGNSPAELLVEVEGLGETLHALEKQLDAVSAEFEHYALTIPNVPLEDVPLGNSAEDNHVVHKWGTPRNFDFPVKDHVELGMAKQQIDAQTAAKISGARFTVLRGGIAQLHRALAQFMLDLHTQEHQYLEMNIPLIVNAESLLGTGQLPKFEEDMFCTVLSGQRRYLISTSEIALTNIVRDTILSSDELPLRMVAHSQCFRSEAGSSGRDTRGMIRQHQFEKVELVSICSPAQSSGELERMTRCAEKVLEYLQLPYRRMLLCTGDMGFTAQKTYDLEVWLPAQQTYREISSCSFCGDFQARRMQARWRNPDQRKPELVHSLNGSGVAVGRALVAVMENYQNKDGSITVPEVLRPYLQGRLKIE